jgi:cholinesterase
LTAYPSDLMRERKFIRLPMINGANSDEGSSFGATGIDNDTALFNSLLTFRNYAISAPNARKLMELYPDDPANQPPFYIKTPQRFPSKGLQWRRSAAINGDMVMISGRRKFCELYTEAGQDVYSYRFDNPLWNGAVTDGSRHFVNVVYSFQNISGALGPLPQYQSYKDLSENIGRAYISFVNDWNPNTSRGMASTLPQWPKYDLRKPKNMVLNSNQTFVEDDTWRKKGIDFLNSIAREILA